MLKWVDWTGRIILIGFAATILYRFWSWWAPSTPDVYLRTDLVDAQKSDTFLTGFATVAIVQFGVDGGEFVPFRLVVDDPDREVQIRGFCYRLYNLSVGYPSLSAAIELSEMEGSRIEPPRVLSANVVEARHGGSATQFQCDSINVVSKAQPREARLAMVQRALEENGQWDGHVKHAANLIVALSHKLSEERRKRIENRLRTLEEGREDLLEIDDLDGLREWQNRMLGAGARESVEGPEAMEDLERLRKSETTPATAASYKADLSRIADRAISETKLDLSRATGYLGSLKLTFSTIGIFSQEKGRWFWKSDQFYIRQDTADATYGTEFTLDLSTTTTGLFGKRRFVVTLPEPSLLSLDRYTSVLVTKPRDFKLSGEDPAGGAIEAALSGDLDQQLSRIRPQAIRFARAILTARLQELVRSDVGEIVVRFSPSETRATEQLMDLLRSLREERENSL
jgi:hypothetical protein